jgi:hypothetical protein
MNTHTNWQGSLLREWLLDIKVILTEQGIHRISFSGEPIPKNELFKKAAIEIRVTMSNLQRNIKL